LSRLALLVTAFTLAFTARFWPSRHPQRSAERVPAFAKIATESANADERLEVRVNDNDIFYTDIDDILIQVCCLTWANVI
jgi:hypothetical protein